MEAVEANFVEGAVLWLARTILANLLPDKLVAWLEDAGLAGVTEKLKFEIERVEVVAAALKGRAAGNRRLARSLGRLKELLYDADDMVDELDYCRLQHQVEGGSGTFASATDLQLQGTNGDGAEQVDGSRDNADAPRNRNGRTRSVFWQYFIREEVEGKVVKATCKYCDTKLRCRSEMGTSVLSNHLKKSAKCKEKQEASGQPPNLPSAADGNSISRKRKRPNETSTHNEGTSTDTMTRFRNTIDQMTLQLQEATSEVLKLCELDSVACSNLYRITAVDPCRRTSSLAQQKMYGRDTEKSSIIKLIKEHKCDGLLVLPIVGIGGIGKTALAQLIYNDPTVKSQFECRVWVWVSYSVDEVRLTREMLDFVSQERHEGISSLAKLQEILTGHLTSKKFLLVLDDVWGSMDNDTWKKLLAPLKSDNTKGNVILVTSRNLSVAKRIGTGKLTKLGALQNDDFWSLFKSCAFGDDNYGGHPNLNTIGQQIAEKLHGNPLAAETAGMLLRENLTVVHWTSILNNEKWKLLHLSRGIMQSLRLSYDQLPYYLQQCFLFCSIFPSNHQFLREELVYMWISEGFVECDPSTKTTEDIGQDNFIDFLNSEFFEKVETKESTRGTVAYYTLCGIMHDFSRLVSRTECASIDSQECNEVLPTIRHLSILTDSAYLKDQHAKTLCNMRFEEKLQSVVTSVRKLRTLVLIGRYDSIFFQTFQNIFQEAHNLRLLQISYADVSLFLSSLVNPTHLRFLKVDKRRSSGYLPCFPIPLSKFYHLQVLDVGHPSIPCDESGLVSSMEQLDIEQPYKYYQNNSMIYLDYLRHLDQNYYSFFDIRTQLQSLSNSMQQLDIAPASIVRIGKMMHFQYLRRLDRKSHFFEVNQLESLNELLQVGVLQLSNINREEANRAKLRDKQHLEKLQLSWMNSNNSPSSASDVIDCLEPHHNLKHLQISGYNGASSPPWLASSVTRLQTLHLEDRGEWQMLPCLGRLPFLTKLNLRNMQNVIAVSIPSLEELVLTEMPKLEKCLCNSVRGLNTSLRVLEFRMCNVLEAFPLFESCDIFNIEQKSWLPHLSDLTVHDCPHLIVSHPLTPSATNFRLSIARVSTLPEMEGFSDRTLKIGDCDFGVTSFWNSSDELRKLGSQILSFHSLRFLAHLSIEGCRNLTSIWFQGFKQLGSLDSLVINSCYKLFSSHELPEDTYQDMAATNFKAFPSLKYFSIENCGILGKWLSLMLRHMQALQKFRLDSCEQITGLCIKEEESGPPIVNAAPEASPSGDSMTITNQDGLLHSVTPLLVS